MFSNNWNSIYKKNQQLSLWPWSEIISAVYKNITFKKKKNILEIGCGAGANIPFFLNNNCSYFGIDGSKHIISKLKKKFPKIKKNLAVCDFTISQPFKMKFDLIIDRGSMTHNDTQSIERSLIILRNSLKKGGCYIGVDWFSSQDMYAKKGKLIVDKYTRKNLPHKSLKNVGKIHFSNKTHLKKLFRNWKIIEMYEKVITSKNFKTNSKRAYWSIVAKKN